MPTAAERGRSAAEGSLLGRSLRWFCNGLRWPGRACSPGRIPGPRTRPVAWWWRRRRPGQPSGPAGSGGSAARITLDAGRGWLDLEGTAVAPATLRETVAGGRDPPV